jgi:3-oxoacyl-[acyl-carrier protein] reductase
LETGLRGRTVLVAASSEGIARVAAQKFAAEGANLALCSRDETKIHATAEEIRQQYPVEVMHKALDVTEAEQVHDFVESVANRFGRIDVCVTNAGGPPPKMFLETHIAEWRQAVELNLLSVVSLSHGVLPHMQRNQWGRIVTITSITVRQPVHNLVYSNTVRAAVVGLVKSLSNEFGKDGITVNNVGPGFTATERLKQFAAASAKASGISDEEMLKRLGSETALKRVGQPDEVADAIVWLASERASYITGQTLIVDGGAYKGF